MSDRILALDNDWVIRRQLTQWNSTLDLYDPVEGLPVTAHLSAEAGGTAIHASLSGLMTERESGDYYLILQGADITAYLASYIGKTIYEVVSLAGDYQDYAKIRVAESRHAR